jgi:hypothetical protein
VTRAFGRLLVALLFVSWLHAIPGFGAARETPSNFVDFPLYGLPVFSDFDGDNKLDQAALSSNGPIKTIHITWGSSSRSSLPFDSGVSDHGRLLSGDIDSDGEADLIWVSQSDPSKFVVWLGDGRGHFSIGTDSELDFHRIQALLGDGEPGLTEKSNGGELPGALLSTSFAAPPAFAYPAHIFLPEQSFSAAQPLALCALFFSVLRKRGPPPKLF